MAIQELIHRLEVGAGFKNLRRVLLVLAVLGLVVGYNWRDYRSPSAPEAMDAAQLARNLSQGKGFTTQCIRPVSIYLLKQHVGNPTSADADPARLKTAHPDLANAPLYPLLLAGLMKIAPMNYQLDSTKGFWNQDGRFARYQPDFIIGIFNQLLLLVTSVGIFLLARKLFDAPVAWLAGGLWLGCEQIWRFSLSGLPTILLVAFFVTLVWVMIILEEEVREPKRGEKTLLWLAVAAGLVVGAGALTRYSFGWLIVPVVAFIAVFGGPRRVLLCVLAFGVFMLVLSPWVYRNYALCGLPFGTASYAPLETTFIFPQFKLLRSLEPNFNLPFLTPLINKLMNNCRNILLSDFLRLGGGWAAPFFLVGLMLGFLNPALRRLRYFLVACLGTLIVVQALGRTQLSEMTPEFNSENLIVLTLPIVLIFASSLFFTLLDQINFIAMGLRYIAIGIFCVIMCLPMIFAFLPPRPNPVSYPPYYPPAIQQTAGWMKDNELMMSDIPWAVAWYGNRQCVWTTLNAQQDFFAINDYLKPIRALYLTPETMDSRFLSEWVRAGEHSWGTFVFGIMATQTTPPSFPLRKMPTGFLPEQLFLTDWDRWKVNPADADPKK